METKPITLKESGITSFEGIALVPNQIVVITNIEFKDNRFPTTMITSLDNDGEERVYYSTSKVIRQICEDIIAKYGDTRGKISPPIVATVVEKRSASTKQFYFTLE